MSTQMQIYEESTLIGLLSTLEFMSDSEEWYEKHPVIVIRENPNSFQAEVYLKLSEPEVDEDPNHHAFPEWQDNGEDYGSSPGYSEAAGYWD